MNPTNRVLTSVVLGFVALSSPCVAAGNDDFGGLSGGGEVSYSAEGSTDGCIGAEQRARAEAEVEAFRATDLGQEWLARSVESAFPFRFYPQGGNLYRDIRHSNYVDLDHTIGLRDFECSNHTYNGHRGHDSGLRSFDEQEIGVPVYAVADGVVVSVHDGEPDRNTEWLNQPGNYVIIQHAGGMTTRYWHFKTGSVTHVPGNVVEAGEQIGLTASSGNSTGPHLHFEARTLGGSAFETMTGSCNEIESYWDEQWTIDRSFRLRDFGFVRGEIHDFYEGPPYEYPRDNHTDFSDGLVSYWMHGMNLPGDSTYRFRFIAPDGRLDYDSGDRAIGFTTGTDGFNWFWATWRWTITDMRFEAGSWTVQVEINGVQEIEFEVRVFEEEQLPHIVNRPPYPVTATIEPENPAEDDVLWARIYPDLIHDDPDFDVVRYTYTWKVNGETVRDIVSAGHADVLPASYWAPGDDVTCDVAVSDGVCPGDVTGDRVVDLVDLAVMINAWGTEFVDVTGDEVVDAFDLAVVLAGWGECP